MMSIILAIALCQTVYEWTDADGVLHMTDDASAVPSGVEVKKSERPRHVPTVTTTQKLTSSNGSSTSAPNRQNQCQLAKARVAALERERSEANEALVKAEAEEMATCQAKLNQLGQGAYAQCVSQRPSREKFEQRIRDIEKRLDAAQDELRKVQIRGCQN